MLRVVVVGDPQAQGSKVAGRGKGGHVFLRDSNARVLHPWRNAVAAAAIEAIGDEGPALGPLSMVCAFTLRRPQSHYRTGKHAGELKASAPTFVASRPDLDKLVRSICDALSGIAYRDDAQIVHLIVQKRYGEPAGVTIWLSALPGGREDAPTGSPDRPGTDAGPERA